MEENQGFITLHRKILDSPIMVKPEYFSIWITLLLLANHKDNYFLWNNKKMICKRGQVLTGRDKLAKMTGVNRNMVERALKFLESENQVEQQKTSKFRLITINNYDQYQKVEQQMSNRRATDEQQMSTNNNDNNIIISKDIINNIPKKNFKKNKPSPKKGIDGLKILQEISPVLSDGLSGVLADRQVDLQVSRSGWLDIRKSYSEDNILSATKKAVHWIADQNDAGNSAVKERVLRTTRLQKFLESYPKLNPNLRQPGESLKAFTDRVGLQNLITD